MKTKLLYGFTISVAMIALNAAYCGEMQLNNVIPGESEPQQQDSSDYAEAEQPSGSSFIEQNLTTTINAEYFEKKISREKNLHKNKEYTQLRNSAYADYEEVNKKIIKNTTKLESLQNEIGGLQLDEKSIKRELKNKVTPKNAKKLKKVQDKIIAAQSERDNLHQELEKLSPVLTEKKAKYGTYITAYSSTSESCKKFYLSCIGKDQDAHKKKFEGRIEKLESPKKIQQAYLDFCSIAAKYLKKNNGDIKLAKKVAEKYEKLAIMVGYNPFKEETVQKGESSAKSKHSHKRKSKHHKQKNKAM